MNCLDKEVYQQEYRINQQNGDKNIKLQRQLLQDLVHDRNDDFLLQHWQTTDYFEDDFNTGNF